MITPRILVVEETITRNTLKIFSRQSGYEVFEASDGNQMHRIISSQEIHLAG